MWLSDRARGLRTLLHGAAGMTSDVPGDQRLEGQQTPAIALEKIAPQEIQVDRQATFQSAFAMLAMPRRIRSWLSIRSRGGPNL